MRPNPAGQPTPTARRRLWRYAAPQKGTVALAAVCVLVANLATLNRQVGR